MNEKEMKLAVKIGLFLRHFPDEWQEYQDWLREIIASLPILQNRYRPWQVALILRWRLFYFVIYVGSTLLLHRLRKIFMARLVMRSHMPIEEKMLLSESVLAVLHRIATLFAVMELTLCAIAALTGILLAFYYEPTAIAAHSSLTQITTHISSGAMILSMHDTAGNILIAVTLVQLVVMFLGGQLRLSWVVAWTSGILLTLTAIALSWTAVILDWDQIGFWRLKIELGTIESIPWIGASLRTILAGGEGISSVTFQHMYTFHSYVLAIAALVLSITHLGSLLLQEQHWQSHALPLQRGQEDGTPYQQESSSK